jgi:Predicted S-adenosylmethionine-dependent methyltransferase involved in cell envelope biogenesis
MALYRPVIFAHKILKEQLNHTSLVVDATVGNGFDSLFIAEILGRNGKLFGFDIQKQAIDNTQAKLQDVQCQIQLFLQGHETIFQTLVEYCRKIDAVVFNLGYLPYGQPEITTQTATTFSAIIQAFALLRVKGIIVIVAYRGHDTGKIEQNFLDEWLAKVADKQAYITKYEQFNTQNDAPLVYCIEKRY